jgi:hypothetical protein
VSLEESKRLFKLKIELIRYFEVENLKAFGKGYMSDKNLVILRSKNTKNFFRRKKI